MVERVPDWGDPASRLVLVGEAPGRNEMATGRPFVGASGHRLDSWWRPVGLTRSDFYITNVLDYMPEDIDKVPEEEMRAAIERLRDRLSDLPNVTLIVPTGNYALYALTGKGKVSFHNRDGKLTRPGIFDWRGSVLSTVLNGRPVKVIPTLHPAYVLRMPEYERRTLRDWQRIAGDRHFPELRTPVCYHHIKPTATQAIAFIRKMHVQGIPVSMDIETPRGTVVEVAVTDNLNVVWEKGVKRGDPRVVRYKSGAKKGQPKMRQSKGMPYVGCIGLSNDGVVSLTIPTTRAYWTNPEDYDAVMNELFVFLKSDTPKILQNGMFDAGFLAWEFGVKIGGWLWDTRAMHHALDPLDAHDLAYMASVFTRHPFWKHEAKDPDEATKYASNSEALWTYNGIDACATWNVWKALKAELEAANMVEFYHNHYSSVFPALLDMLLHGIALDRKKMAAKAAELDVEAAELAVKIREMAGIDLIPNKAISNQRLMFYVYGRRAFEGDKKAKAFDKLAATYPDCVPLDIPPRHKARGKKGSTITIDEVTVRRLMLRYPDLYGVGSLVLDHRRNRKLREFVDDAKVDVDGRLRCQYGLYTGAGRSNAHETPWRTGRNLQNIDREIRDVFVPD